MSDAPAPGVVVGARLAQFDAATATVGRLASVLVGLIVLVGAAREAYRIGYRDGYRVGDQVALDRPPRAEVSP